MADHTIGKTQGGGQLQGDVLMMRRRGARCAAHTLGFNGRKDSEGEYDDSGAPAHACGEIRPGCCDMIDPFQPTGGSVRHCTAAATV